MNHAACGLLGAKLSLLGIKGRNVRMREARVSPEAFDKLHCEADECLNTRGSPLFCL